METLHDPHFWVLVSFVLFVALAGKKIWLLLTRALDARSEKIRLELDQARRLREEAELVLADYKKKQAEYLKEAEHMLQKAREDANAFGIRAEQDLKTAMAARMQHALDRIEQEETKAVTDVRNHVVDIALAAARALIVDHVGTMSQEELLKLAMADLERKIH